MRRINYRPYGLLILFFFCLLSLPKSSVDRIRSVAVCSFAPFWKGLHSIKKGSLFLLTVPPIGGRDGSAQSARQIEMLSQENLMLHAQIQSVKEWVLSEERIQGEWKRWQSVASIGKPEAESFLKRRAEELARRLSLQMKSAQGKVIFREPISWSSTVWVNVGERYNLACKEKIVCKNSPVLVGSSVVGIVDFVGQDYCSVRLITDGRLVPSVRVARGSAQNRQLIESLDSAIFSLERRGDLMKGWDGGSELVKLLHECRQRLLKGGEELLLAKGEIHGTSRPLWRARGQRLKGVGFNYDFGDSEGMGRDLRTGELVGMERRKEGVPLLREGDLLVTSGLDGLFPQAFG